MLTEEYVDSVEWILTLVSKYVSSARSLSLQLCQAFGQADLLAGRRAKAIPRDGTTQDGLEFRFHGAGCWISDGKISVDFDFLPDGEIGGFDAWKLHVFSDENPAVVGARSRDEVQNALNGLLARGFIRASEGSLLFRVS